MEPGDTIVLYSENQEFANDEFHRSIVADPQQFHHYFNNNDFYSDIYFDRSYVNLDAASVCNLSDYQKEIDLEVEHNIMPKNASRKHEADQENGLHLFADFDVPGLAISSAAERECKNAEDLHSSIESPQKSANDPVEAKPAKHDCKLVFKITRFNRLTQKEKLLTKNRRIISKCPHTSMKYYAKGMCK